MREAGFDWLVRFGEVALSVGAAGQLVTRGRSSCGRRESVEVLRGAKVSFCLLLVVRDDGPGLVRLSRGAICMLGGGLVGDRLSAVACVGGGTVLLRIAAVLGRMLLRARLQMIRC